MVAGLTVSERERAFVILVAMSLFGVVMAMAGAQDPLGVHGFLVILFSLGLLFVVASAYFKPEPTEARLDSYYDDPSKAGIVLAMAWAIFGHVHGRLGCRPAGLSGLDLRRRLVELRAAAAGAHDRRHLRLRRQRADRHLLPCRAAHVAGAAAGPAQPVVRAARLQPVLPARGHRLL